MRILIVLAAAIITLTLLTTSTQADVVVIYSDSLRTDCTGVVNDWLGIVLYIFHYSPGGATGSRFLIADEVGFGNIEGPILIQPQFPNTGRIDEGIEFDYGGCRSGFIFVCAFYYWDVMGLGGFPLCGEQRILAHPAATSGQVEAIDCSGTPTPAAASSGMLSVEPGCSCPTVTGVSAETPRPDLTTLRNYPNPFASSTSIEYELRSSSPVVLTIYNIRGQRVAEVRQSLQPVGRQAITWNGLDDHGRKVASGIYFYKLEAGGFSQTRKMVILR